MGVMLAVMMVTEVVAIAGMGDEAVGMGVTGSSGAGAGSDGMATTVAPAAGDVNCNVAPSALYVVVVVTIPHCCRPAP